jgi:hypothetical protein
VKSEVDVGSTLIFTAAVAERVTRLFVSTGANLTFLSLSACFWGPPLATRPMERDSQTTSIPRNCGLTSWRLELSVGTLLTLRRRPSRGQGGQAGPRANAGGRSSP